MIVIYTDWKGNAVHAGVVLDVIPHQGDIIHLDCSTALRVKEVHLYHKGYLGDPVQLLCDVIVDDEEQG